MKSTMKQMWSLAERTTKGDECAAAAEERWDQAAQMDQMDRPRKCSDGSDGSHQESGACRTNLHIIPPL